MYVNILNTTIYYEEYGSGDNTILILPGWGNTRPTFTNIINSLKDNFHIYIMDYPNFGKSENIEYEMTIYDYAKIVKKFMEILNINNPVVIAHSFGGRITAILAGKYMIKIKKIILFDVAGIKRRKKLRVFLKEKIYKFLKVIIKLFNSKRLEEKLFNAFASQDYKDIPNYQRKTFQNIINEDLKKYYKNISQETLIIWGEKDKDTPIKDSYLLHKIIKNSGLIIYKNIGHYSYLEKTYESINILYSFLKKDMD